MENKKEKTSLSFSIVDLNDFNPTQPIERVISGHDYIAWGIDNKYPQYIYDLYCNCSTLQSIINGSIDFTIGNKIINNTPFTGKNQDGDTLENVVKKVITDRWIFGGCNIQVIPNKAKQVNEVVWLDTRHCRTNENEDTIYYSKKWGSWGKSKYIKYGRFCGEELEDSQVYYYKGNKTRATYPVPDFVASIISAETQIEIHKFHHNTIINNFMVNGILNFNNASDVTDEVKEEIERKVNEKFSGSSNAGRLMIAWNEDKDKAVSFERLQCDDFDKKYEMLSDSTRDNIFISLRALPVLFGMTVQTGFNTQEYEEAFALYNRTAILPKQNEIKAIFDDIFQMENAIDFEPFTL